MATIKKDIEEISEKITTVKRIVKKRVEELQDKRLQETPLSESTSWKDLEFSHPERTVRIGTLFSGIGAFEEALKNEYDLIILDIMLPSMNGFEICRRLKREKQSPIIMLSAKDSVIDKVNGLQIGADDYIAKPFAIEELLARIEVVFRRQDNLNNYIKR